MNEYLVMFNPNPNKAQKYYPSLHIWPEILTILIKMSEVGGEIHIYRLDKGHHPEQVFVNCANHTEFWLEDMYGNHVEG
jgi:hypothetical protein